jgi:AcrR family transcriptional regulator
LAQRAGRPRSPEADEAILRATIDIIAETGFEALTVEGVAARANVGRPTIYRRYRNKLELIFAAVSAISEQELLYRDTGTSRGDLRLIASTLADRLLGTELGRLWPAMIFEGNRTPELAVRYHAFNAQRREAFLTALERCVARGDLRADIDPDIVADFLAAPIFLRFLVTGEPIDTAFIDTVVDGTMRAFAP